MTTEKVRRRIEANATSVADGLENLQKDLLALFNAQLDKYRDEALKREQVYQSHIITMVNELGDVKRELTAVKSGIGGLSIQLSEYEAIVPAEVRRRIVEQVEQHEIRLNKLDGGDDRATDISNREKDGHTDSGASGEAEATPHHSRPVRK